MFLDPFGKELDLPPGFVEPCGRLCRESEVVGPEYDAPNGFGVVKRDTTQGAGILPRRLRTCQHDRRFVSQPRCIVDPATNMTAEVESAFSSHHENCRTTRESVKASKIDISLVHHVERARFDWQMIGNSNIVCFLVRNPHGTGKAAAKVQQCMQLYRPVAVTQPRPRKPPQAEVGAKRLIELEFSRSADQLLSKTRRRFAGRVRGWHPPRNSEKPFHGTPHDTTLAQRHAATSRYLTTFRERSVVQMLCRETDLDCIAKRTHRSRVER
jgi:hypothetical protein